VSDVYKIGISILLTNNAVGPALTKLASQFTGLHNQSAAIGVNIGRWRTGLLGVAGVMGGSMILGAMAKMADKGKDIVHQFELMKIQGMSISETQQAAAAAMRVSGSVLTSSYAENLKHMRELRYAFGDTGTAAQYLEPVTRANSILNAMMGGKKDEVWDLVKGLEQKGLTADPKAFNSYIETMTKAVVGSGGKVTPSAFFSAFKYGRTAMLGWDETFVGQYLPRLIQSMGTGSGGGGSGGPGNALMSAFAKVVQGQMPKPAAEEWARMGLAPHGVQHIKGSSQSQIKGGMAGSDLFMGNPYEWVQRVLMPALKMHHITSQNDIISEISKMFPVRTASQIIGEMGLQGRFREGQNSPFEKDAALSRNNMGGKSYNELISGDYATALGAFNTQFESLLKIIGSKLIQPGGPLTTGLGLLATGLQKLGAFADAHPMAIQIVAGGIAALGAVLVAAGGAAILAALGVGGWLVVGIASLGAAITGLALNWDKFVKMMTSIPSLLGLGGGGQHGSVVPGGSASTPQVRGDVFLDKEKVGNAVWNYGSNLLNSKPVTGSAYSDPTSLPLGNDAAFAIP
jgi:hypothetical protein